jgi:uncharacterized phage protein (TIGR02218 family)
MKILDTTFEQALNSASSAIAWCWLIKRKDGIEQGFTSCDLMLPIDSVPYQPYTGFAPSADSNSEGLSKNNSQELVGLLTSDQISAGDLLSGKYDNALVTCFLVDVTNLPTSLTEYPPKFLMQYERAIARVTQNDLGFTFELRDDDWLLETDLGKQTSKFCGYDLGGTGCGVNLTSYSFNQVITAVNNRFQFTCSGSFNPGQFSRGKIVFTSGLNQGISKDISKFELGNEITLWQPFPYSIAVGDGVTLVQGCGKTLYDCVVRYDNAINSDSEPHIPTVDQAFNTPID